MRKLSPIILIIVLLAACATPKPTTVQVVQSPTAVPKPTAQPTTPASASPTAVPEPTVPAPASPTAVPTTAVRGMVATPHALYLPVVAYTPAMTWRGWARAYSNLSDAEMRSLRLNVYYDYGLRYPFPHRAGAMYIPYLWCDIYPSMRYDAPMIRYFDELAKLPDGYSSYLLFLNEPDLRGSTVDGDQCERTPRQAAYMLMAARKACPGCVIVGPSVSHEDYRQGWPWLREFYGHAVRLGVRLPEVAAIHTYLPEEPQLIIDDLFALLAEFDGAAQTVWVTEFAVGEAQAARMIEYYETDKRVEAYFWFTARGWLADLIRQDGTLTPLGEIYRGGASRATGAAYP